MKMMMHFKTVVIVMTALLVIQSYAYGQTKKSAENYLKELSRHLKLNYHGNSQKYKMTAVYNNKDLYGNFMNKTGVTGEYTCGLEGGRVKWNNVYLAHSDTLQLNQPYTVPGAQGKFAMADIGEYE